MAARKILPFSTFTIFLTLLLLSSRIYCHDNSNEEDCEDEDNSGSDTGPGSGPGPVPGNIGPGKGPGLNPGKGPGSNPGKGPGSTPGKGPGSDPGKGPGSDPMKGLGSDPLKGLGSDPLKGLGSLPVIGDITQTLVGILDPAFLKSLLDYGGDLIGMLTPVLTAITDAVGTILKDPAGFLADPNPVLTKLLKGILGPIAGVVQDVTIEIPSEGGAIEAQLFDALPPQLGFLQGPIDTILNLVYGIGFDAADAVQGAADLDGAAILKSLGEIGDSVKNLFSGLANLPNELKSAGG